LNWQLELKLKTEDFFSGHGQTTMMTMNTDLDLRVPLNGAAKKEKHEINRRWHQTFNR